ncbi:epimerase [Intrasporangium oryzae NRRL B-24470]|uniref:Epimerase n=1 Tax=Intrasporangium oryzae NRRL B-24470 TaxID=1386089 RepID=W9G9K0_9MICO|nr:epimerase [Intrasporangium oryzae NRRL B-24470]
MLVIGATGYIGQVVTEHLVARGHQVIALTRPGFPDSDLPAGVTARVGDLTEPASLGPAVTPEVDAVVNLATPSGDESVDSAAAAALLAPLEGTGRAYVYASGVWVLGPSHGSVQDESTPTNPLDIVGYRPRIEQQVLGAASRGVRSVVVRPGIAHGRAGGIPALLVSLAAQHGAGLYVGEPARWPMVHVEDLADRFVAAVEGADPGALLHAVAEQGVDTTEIAAAAAAAAGVDLVRSWPLPEAAGALGAPFAQALACDQVVSAAVTAGRLGWSPSRPGVLVELRHGSYGAADAA